MKGTQHFIRMNYNVRRGLREIVAPSHRLPKTEWATILKNFSHRCAYCGNVASAANRGIVPDHLIAVADFGELVAGNTVPACQTCNDSRGKKNWRDFLRERFPGKAEMRIGRIEAHIQRHDYKPCAPESSLVPAELSEYNAILKQWGRLFVRAQALHAAVAKRRSTGC